MKLCSDKMFIEIFDKQEDVRRPKILLLKFTKIAKMTSK